MSIRTVFVFLVVFLVPLTAQATVAGNVEYLSGEAWIERSGEKVLLNSGDRVDAGDVVVTTLSGRVQLLMQDGSKVFVGRKSRITIDRYETQKGILSSGSFNMLWGKVRFLVAKLSKGASSFSVQTKTATIGVRGTQFAVIANRPLTPKQIVPTTVMLFEGAVVGRSLKGNITNIKPGKLAVFNPAGKITTRNISKKDIKRLNIKPLEFSKAPARSIEPKGKPSAGTKLKVKPVERTKPKAKPEAKPAERIKPDISPNALQDRGSSGSQNIGHIVPQDKGRSGLPNVGLNVPDTAGQTKSLNIGRIGSANVGKVPNVPNVPNVGKIQRPPSMPKNFGKIQRPPSMPKNFGKIQRPPSIPKNFGKIQRPPSMPKNFGKIQRPPSMPKNFGKIQRPPSIPKNFGKIQRPPSIPKNLGNIRGKGI